MPPALRAAIQGFIEARTANSQQTKLRLIARGISQASDGAQIPEWAVPTAEFLAQIAVLPCASSLHPCILACFNAFPEAMRGLVGERLHHQQKLLLDRIQAIVCQDSGATTEGGVTVEHVYPETVVEAWPSAPLALNVEAFVVSWSLVTVFPSFITSSVPVTTPTERFHSWPYSVSLLLRFAHLLLQPLVVHMEQREGRMGRHPLSASGLSEEDAIEAGHGATALESGLRSHMVLRGVCALLHRTADPLHLPVLQQPGSSTALPASPTLHNIAYLCARLLCQSDSVTREALAVAGLALGILTRHGTTTWEGKDAAHAIYAVFFGSDGTVSDPHAVLLATHLFGSCIPASSLPFPLFSFSAAGMLAWCDTLLLEMPRPIILLPLSSPGLPRYPNLLCGVIFPRVVDMCRSPSREDLRWLSFAVLQHWLDTTRCHVLTSGGEEDCAIPETVLSACSACFFGTTQGSSGIVEEIVSLIIALSINVNVQSSKQLHEVFNVVVDMLTPDRLLAHSDAPLLHARQRAVLGHLLHVLLGMDWSKRAKYAPLGCLVKKMGVQELLVRESRIMNNLLEAHVNAAVSGEASHFMTTVLHAVRAEALAKQGDPVTAVVDMVVQPMAGVLRKACAVVNDEEGDAAYETALMRGMESYALPRLLHDFPEVLAPLFQTLSGGPQATVVDPQSFDASRLAAWILVGKVARGLSLVSFAVENDAVVLVTHTVPQTSKQKAKQANVPSTRCDATFLKTALVHPSHDIRLMALEMALVCKIAFVPTALELSALELFLPLAATQDSSSYRQKTITHARRFLERCEESAYGIFRDHVRLYRFTQKKTGKQEEMPSMVDTVPLFQSLNRFFQFLAHYILSNLCPQVPSGQKCLALDLLRVIAETWSGSRVPAGLASIRGEPWTPVEHVPALRFLTSTEALGALLTAVVDGFDEVRRRVHALMAQSTVSLIVDLAHQPDRVAGMCQWALNALRSPRFREMEGGAVVLSIVFEKIVGNHGLIVRFIPLPEAAQSPPPMIVEVHPSPPAHPSLSPLVFFASMVSVFRRQVQLAQGNLQAAGQDTLQGAAVVIRMLLSGLKDWKEPVLCDACSWCQEIREKKHCWRQIVSDILELVFQSASIVMPILSRVHEGQEVAMEPISVALKTLCWLTIKESGLLLGAMATHPHLSRSLLTPQQLESMGEKFFIPVMLAAQHTGAIDKAAVGFMQLNECLTNSGDPQLTRLPQQWLDRLLATSIRDSQWLYVLRRSAGLPFMVCSILTCEPRNFPCVLLPRALDVLLSAATVPATSEEDDAAAQVHSLNITRAIFRETMLSVSVMSHVPHAFEVCLKTLSSPSWYLRNSGMLCFASVLDRAVGKKAVPTGKEFFARFPSIHSLLVHVLQDSVDSLPHVDADCVADSARMLYPALVVLSKLRPSIYDHPVTADSQAAPDSLAVFIPLIMACASHPQVFVRLGAARALVSVMDWSQAEDMIHRLLHSLPCEPFISIDPNRIHGILLQLFHILCHTQREELTPVLVCRVAVALRPYLWLAGEYSPSLYVAALLFQIVVETLLMREDLPWPRRPLDSFEAATVDAFSEATAEMITVAEVFLKQLQHNAASEQTRNAVGFRTCIHHATRTIVWAMARGWPPTGKGQLLSLLEGSEWQLRQSLLQSVKHVVKHGGATVAPSFKVALLEMSCGLMPFLHQHHDDATCVRLALKLLLLLRSRLSIPLSSMVLPPTPPAAFSIALTALQHVWHTLQLFLPWPVAVVRPLEPVVSSYPSSRFYVSLVLCGACLSDGIALAHTDAQAMALVGEMVPRWTAWVEWASHETQPVILREHALRSLQLSRIWEGADGDAHDVWTEHLQRHGWVLWQLLHDDDSDVRWRADCVARTWTEQWIPGQHTAVWKGAEGWLEAVEKRWHTSLPFIDQVISHATGIPCDPGEPLRWQQFQTVLHALKTRAHRLTSAVDEIFEAEEDNLYVQRAVLSQYMVSALDRILAAAPSSDVQTLGLEWWSRLSGLLRVSLALVREAEVAQLDALWLAGVTYQPIVYSWLFGLILTLSSLVPGLPSPLSQEALAQLTSSIHPLCAPPIQPYIRAAARRLYIRCGRDDLAKDEGIDGLRFLGMGE